MDEALGWAEAKLAGLYCNAPRNATKIKVNVKLDPFTAMGQAWVRAMRVAMAEAEAAPMSEWGSGDGGVEREPKALGRFYLTGVAPEQMDGMRPRVTRNEGPAASLPCTASAAGAQPAEPRTALPFPGVPRQARRTLSARCPRWSRSR